MNFPRTVRRFLIGYLILHLLAAGFFVFVLSRMTRSQMILAAKSKMGAMTLLLAEHIDELEGGIEDETLPMHIKRIGEKSETRVTLIKPDGSVVADSITGDRDIGSHATRAEVLSAKADGSGFSERYSATLGKPMMYFARTVETEDTNGPSYVRVATPAVTINSSIASIQRYVWLFAIALGGLTALLMSFFSAKYMKPLALFAAAAQRIGVGDYQASINLTRQADEWGDLGDAFEGMKNELIVREERLVENNRHLDSVLSSMKEGVIAIQSDGQVMLANGAACKMLELTRPEIVNKQLFEIVRIPELLTSVEQTQAKRTFSKTEFKTLTKPQKTLSARVSVLADEKRPGVVVVLSDVTALRQLETMRQDFVANVSHELKTPLASIKAYSETLLMGAINDKEKSVDFVKQIEFHAELLNQQIQDLLLLAKVESGEGAFSISAVDLNQVCHSTVEQFSKLVQDHGLNLCLDLMDPAPIARADASAVKTMVKNLLVNAIHYTLDGGTVTLSTSANSSEADGEMKSEAIIRVSDTGIGIAKDQQARVFERFYRVDKSRARDMGGTGLGLAIVKHLSQSFGGSVHLESQLGKGCQFEIRLPSAEPKSAG